MIIVGNSLPSQTIKDSEGSRHLLSLNVVPGRSASHTAILYQLSGVGKHDVSICFQDTKTNLPVPRCNVLHRSKEKNLKMKQWNYISETDSSERMGVCVCKFSSTGDRTPQANSCSFLGNHCTPAISTNSKVPMSKELMPYGTSNCTHLTCSISAFIITYKVGMM